VDGITGRYSETGFEEISRDVRERDFSLVRLNSNYQDKYAVYQELTVGKVSECPSGL